MRLFLVLMAGTSAVDAQAILATADPQLLGAVLGQLQRLTTPSALQPPAMHPKSPAYPAGTGADR